MPYSSERGVIFMPYIIWLEVFSFKNGSRGTRVQYGSSSNFASNINPLNALWGCRLKG